MPLPGFRIFAIALILFAPLCARPASAQDRDTMPSITVRPSESRVARANAGTVGVISGGVDGTYIRIASDLAAVLDDGDRLRVLPVVGKGSLQNISDILYLKGIDVGIVQSDVLAYARLQHLFPGIEQSMQYICKLYDEEVHILARRDIARIQDLAGQTVNVDVRGSGSAMTAWLLFGSLGIQPNFANDDQETALDKLEHGKIAALIYVTGQPARLFTGISPVTGLHFLSVPANRALSETYPAANLTHDAYPALMPADASVPTIAVPSVLAVYDWPRGSERYNKVARFTASFFVEFPKFLKKPRHPKWQQVDLTATVPGWTRFGPAQEAVKVAEDYRSPLKAEFDAFLAQSDKGRGGMTTAQKAALFQQFLSWQRQTHNVVDVGAPIGAVR
jgi:TRAP transporter TAXI family solute receptor